jgi:hypothetical protein
VYIGSAVDELNLPCRTIRKDCLPLAWQQLHRIAIMEATQVYRPTCAWLTYSRVSKQVAYNLISAVVDLLAGEMEIGILPVQLIAYIHAYCR